jgi:hypothetical protein
MDQLCYAKGASFGVRAVNDNARFTSRARLAPVAAILHELRKRS